MGWFSRLALGLAAVMLTVAPALARTSPPAEVVIAWAPHAARDASWDQCGGPEAPMAVVRQAVQASLGLDYRVVATASANPPVARLDVERLHTAAIELWDTLGVDEMDAERPPGVLRTLSVMITMDVAATVRTPGGDLQTQGFQIAPGLYPDDDPRAEVGCDMRAAARRKGLKRAGALLGAKVLSLTTGSEVPATGMDSKRLIAPWIGGDYGLGDKSPHIGPDWMWLEKPTPAQRAAYAPRLTKAGGASLQCLLDETGRLRSCQVVNESFPRAGLGRSALAAVTLYRMKTRDPMGNPLVGRTVNLWIAFPGSARSTLRRP
jgi:hypothetical protein